ncbi:MAG TPA: Ig-like domain-containing protein, partial [Gemmatimonadaceae bacterium]|nr:Ig-like domain-containing protein [Gemmatimonadaceae bacterium]
MKHNALAALSLALLLGAGLSCDNATGLPKTGGITITLLSPTTGAPIAARMGDADAASHDLIPVDGAIANLTLTGVRITVSGPTNKTVTSQTASGGFFDVTVDGLSPGSYSVTVEGLVGNEVAHFGQTSGVGVTAGTSTPASVTFPLFEPAINLAALPDTTDVLHFSVSFGAVQNATSYIVQWSKSPSMANAQTQTVTNTTANITVADEGNYYIAVKAVNATVPNGGKSSTIQVVYAFQGVATVTVTPATPSIGFGGTQQLAADAKDADNATVPNVSWFWSSDNPSVATVTQGGLVTGVSGGTATITAVGKGMPGSTTVTVGAQLATKLAFSIQPSSSVAGDPLSPAVQVEIQDANGNRVSSARDPVTIAFGANPGSGTLTGTKVVNAINGIASFTGLWVNKAAAGYTLTANSGALSGATSSTFTVSPAAPAKLSFSAQPANKEANTSLAAVTVTIADLFDNTTTATNNVTVSLGQNFYKNFAAAGGTLSGTQTVAAVNGVATFSTLK